MPNRWDKVLEELRLPPQRLGIAPTPRGKPPRGAVGRVRRSLLALLVVIGVGQVNPEAAIVTKHSPGLVEHIQEMADIAVRVIFMAQLTVPIIGPGGNCAVAPKQVERRGRERDLELPIRQP